MEKIKKSMRREDGFTLVELLAVIVILGIILAIAIPAIGNVISKSKGDADDADKALVEDAARIYVVAEKIAIPKDATASDVTIRVQADLVSGGYLDNFKTEGNVVVARTADGVTYTYTAGNEGTTAPPKLP